MGVGHDPGRSPGIPLPELVLASTSVYRRALLERLGVPFRWRAPLCDEEVFKSEEIDPRSLAKTLAHAKASSLAVAEPGATLIGCDQVVSFQGQVFGKPGSVARAVDQLSAMAGQSHELITALVVVAGERVFKHTDVTSLQPAGYRAGRSSATWQRTNRSTAPVLISWNRVESSSSRESSRTITRPSRGCL